MSSGVWPFTGARAGHGGLRPARAAQRAAPTATTTRTASSHRSSMRGHAVPRCHLRRLSPSPTGGNGTGSIRQAVVAREAAHVQQVHDRHAARRELEDEAARRRRRQRRPASAPGRSARVSDACGVAEVRRRAADVDEAANRPAAGRRVVDPQALPDALGQRSRPRPAAARSAALRRRASCPSSSNSTPVPPSLRRRPARPPRAGTAAGRPRAAAPSMSTNVKPGQVRAVHRRADRVDRRPARGRARARRTASPG